jgi:DUF4097 and DUF4098 domain-containing protein YvlB
MKSPFAAACIVLSVSTGLLAQMHNNTEKQMTCDNRGYDGDRARHCDIREQTLPAGRFAVEGHNGSVTVKGWLQSNVLVRARIESAAPTQSAADSLASQVSISSGGGDVHAIGPNNTDDNSWWSASYEIFVPQSTDLSIKSHNGGVAIADVRGQIRFEAHNGGVHLKRVAGDVSGGTHNGGIEAELMGTLWEGRQLELSTNNGGITVSMPAGYSAHVQAETTNGRIESDFPITVSGQIRPRQLDTNIGSGGSPIHLTTHNGAVSLRRAGSQQ